MQFRQTLRHHIKAHGDVDMTVGLIFTIHEVHDHLEENWVPEVHTASLGSARARSHSSANADVVISSAEIMMYEDDELDPTISAFQHHNQKFQKQ